MYHTLESVSWATESSLIRWSAWGVPTANFDPWDSTFAYLHTKYDVWNVVSSATEYSTHDYIHRRNMEMVGDMKATEESSPCHINMHSSFSVVPQTPPSHKNK